MAGTYGAAGLNPYTIPGVSGTLSNEVNATTGVTQVYKRNIIGNQQSLGTYDPKTKKFTPQKDALGSIIPTDTEVKALTSPEGTKIIANAAIQTAQKAGAPNAQQLISPNSAPSGGTPTPQAPQQGGANGPAPTQLPAPGESVGDLRTIEVPLENENQLSIAPTSGLRYPKEMKTEQDKIKFQAVKIKPRTASGNSQGLQFGFGTPEYDPADGPVCLAIQSPISDQNSVDWGPDSVSAIDAAVFNLSYGFIKNGFTGEEPKTGAEEISGLAGTYQERIQRFLAGKAAGLNNVLARTDNVILNPNLELLFQAPQLRPFTFTFKMSARNKGEANDIKSIIKYFKYHMAVRKEKGIFLKAPHVFTIRYLKGEEEPHPGINVISPNSTAKACALTNCSVDYTPLGSYMTYNDGTMVSYTLNLQFQEITPIYDTDYTDAQPIGY
jgi:hypothetical protein